jgi:hypothetical protein
MTLKEQKLIRNKFIVCYLHLVLLLSIKRYKGRGSSMPEGNNKYIHEKYGLLGCNAM